MIFIVIAALVISLWALGAAQAAWRKASKITASELSEAEEWIPGFQEKTNIGVPCAACRTVCDPQFMTKIDFDLQLRPSGTALLPIIIEVCERCITLAS